MKLKDVIYRLLLYLPNFQEDILLGKQIVLHEYKSKDPDSNPGTVECVFFSTEGFQILQINCILKSRGTAITHHSISFRSYIDGTTVVKSI